MSHLLRIKCIKRTTYQISIKTDKICICMVRKHCGKRRKCWEPAFSPFPTMFSKKKIFHFFFSFWGHLNSGIRVKGRDIYLYRRGQSDRWRDFRFYFQLFIFYLHYSLLTFCTSIQLVNLFSEPSFSSMETVFFHFAFVKYCHKLLDVKK